MKRSFADMCFVGFFHSGGLPYAGSSKQRVQHLSSGSAGDVITRFFGSSSRAAALSVSQNASFPRRISRRPALCGRQLRSPAFRRAMCGLPAYERKRFSRFKRAAQAPQTFCPVFVFSVRAGISLHRSGPVFLPVVFRVFSRKRVLRAPSSLFSRSAEQAAVFAVPPRALSRLAPAPLQ